MTRLLLRDVAVSGRRVDVLIERDRVVRVGPTLPATGLDEVIDGNGGALLPGLHDHHVHLLAAAASLSSVDCGPPAVTDLDELARALRGAATEDGWVRGTGYHESVAGDLDRHRLDDLLPGRPVRVQHRSGALWMLNSAALAVVRDGLDRTRDVERDEHGEPTGRLWRYDARLRASLETSVPSLARLGARLAATGLTGVTDATPDLDSTAVSAIASATTLHDLPLRVMLLGSPAQRDLPGDLCHGPRKILLRDHDLPDYGELVGVVRAAREGTRPVAVHCVSRESLLLTLAVLDEVGHVAGDRIEHAALVPEAVIPRMARAGLHVVTQPDFVHLRGDDYLRDVDPRDLEELYRVRSLRDAAVKVAISSDAPYSSSDPWTVMRAACRRRTRSGRVLGPGETLHPRQALASYLSDARTPGGPARRVAPGERADLVLLHVPLATALDELTSANVRVTIRAGAVHGAG
ncbi:MAG: amidohydrolase family protein [Nocardioides sp.]|uniref:amidohydrolase family protein n=1 Tax=Nocardioides sp. TaxID=35761 RepID=UPI0039E2345B